MEGKDKKNEHGLSIGDRVQLHSLLRSPELNGICGKILKPEDPSTGRVDVEIENNGSLVDESLGPCAVNGESWLMRMPFDPLKRAT